MTKLYTNNVPQSYGSGTYKNSIAVMKLNFILWRRKPKFVLIIDVCCNFLYVIFSHQFVYRQRRLVETVWQPKPTELQRSSLSSRNPVACCRARKGPAKSQDVSINMSFNRDVTFSLFCAILQN